MKSMMGGILHRLPEADFLKTPQNIVVDGVHAHDSRGHKYQFYNDGIVFYIKNLFLLDSRIEEMQRYARINKIGYEMLYGIQ